jgi:hypothetical protein
MSALRQQRTFENGFFAVRRTQFLPCHKATLPSPLLAMQHKSIVTFPWLSREMALSARPSIQWHTVRIERRISAIEEPIRFR